MLIAAGIAVLALQYRVAPTTFIQSRGAFTGSRAGGAHMLRIDAARGRRSSGPSPTPDRGLHLVDGNIAQGDLVKGVRRQIRAYRRR